MLVFLTFNLLGVLMVFFTFNFLGFIIVSIKKYASKEQKCFLESYHSVIVMIDNH